MEQEISNRNNEKLAWNLSGSKIDLISKLMGRGEMALVEDNDPTLQLKCWKSIATLIDNRLSLDQKRHLKKLYVNISKKAYIKNKYVDEQWERGCWQWYQNQYISIPKRLEIYVNEYVKYVNYLLKKIGMDIKTKDNSLEELE